MRVLAALAKTDGDFEVREAAVNKLTDQALLTDIAKKDPFANVREAAAKRRKELAGHWPSRGPSFLRRPPRP